MSVFCFSVITIHKISFILKKIPRYSGVNSGVTSKYLVLLQNCVNLLYSTLEKSLLHYSTPQTNCVTLPTSGYDNAPLVK